LKRTFTQKVKEVPFCAADSFDALLKLYVKAAKYSVGAVVQTDVNRRARTSAALIGLAISMGAAGVLLPTQGDEALAFEPMATEPNVTNNPAEPSTSVSPKPAVATEVVAVSTPSTQVLPEVSVDSQSTPAPVVEHQVQKGETLWEISKSYEVQPQAIAASNKIQSGDVLPEGQKLKIPPVNGIVHQVKAGETVEKLSESYGVEPTQLQVSAPVSKSSQLQTGVSVTVPGNVDDLLKRRQDAALNNLKEQRNRLNDSLAELRFEESINQSERVTLGSEASYSGATLASPVTVSSQFLKTEDLVAKAPRPNGAIVPTKPVIISVPTPEIAATPTVTPSSAKEGLSSVVMPLSTPQIAATPEVKPSSAKQSEPSVVLSLPTPEIAATPTVTPSAPKQSEPSVSLPVPSPQIAATPIVIPSPTTPQTAAQPQVPPPVVMQSLVPVTAANVYKVKPGDTLEVISRRYGFSSSELIEANGLNNPNVLGVNQSLTIPQRASNNNLGQSVTLLPGINQKLNNSASGQEEQQLAASTFAIPAVSEKSKPVQPKSAPLPELAQSTVVSEASAKSPVVVEQKSRQSAENQQNPYIEQLRSDILRLREEYQYRQKDSVRASAPVNIPVSKESTQASAPLNIPVPSSTTSLTANSNNPDAATRINPEFNPKGFNDSLEAELQRQQQQQPNQQARRPQQKIPQGTINIEVPPPENSSTQPGLLATGPAPADGYNPSIQIPVGQPVSPDQPPFSPSDIYVPGAPSQSNGLIWPAKGVLTSGYGWRWGRMHKGIDIAAAVGTPIVAAAPGVVVSAGWNSGGYGNLVEVQHADGSLTLYAHNNRILVRRGQEVAQGQQISEMGSTGQSTGPHLHFEVHPKGRGAVNPIAYLPGK